MANTLAPNGAARSFDVLWSHFESNPDALSLSQKTELRALLKEKDPELLSEGLSSLASRLERAGQAASAAYIYQAALESFSEGSDATFRRRIQSRLDGIQGRGNLGGRADFLINRFTKDAFDPKTIAPMMLGTSVYSLTRTLALGRLGTSGLFRAVGPRLAASSLGFAAEVPAFALSARAMRPASSQEPSVAQELAGAAITLGFLKTFGHGAQVLGATSILRHGSRFQQLLLSQTAMFCGLMAAHQVEARLGLRPHVDGATTVTDTLASMLSLGIGASLAHRALGSRYAAMQGELNWRFKTYSNEAKLGPENPSIFQAMSPAFSATGASKRSSPSFMQMSALDRPGEEQGKDLQPRIGDLTQQIQDLKIELGSTQKELGRLESLVVAFLRSLVGLEPSVKRSAMLALYESLNNESGFSFKGLYSRDVVERKLGDLKVREVRELLKDFVEFGQSPDWFNAHISLIARHLGGLDAKSRKQWLQQLGSFLSKEDGKLSKYNLRTIGPNLKPAELSRVIAALGRGLEQPESEANSERLEALAIILEYADGATQLAWIERVESILRQPASAAEAGQAKKLASFLYQHKTSVFGFLRAKTDLGTSLGHLYTLKTLNGELESSHFFEDMLKSSPETRQTAAGIMFPRLAHLGFDQPPLLYFASFPVQPPAEILREKAVEWEQLVDRRSFPSELKAKRSPVLKISDWQYRIGEAFDQVATNSEEVAQSYPHTSWRLMKIVPPHGLNKASKGVLLRKIEELRQKIITRLLHTGWKKGELPDATALREALTSEDQYKNAPLISAPTVHGEVLLLNGVHRTAAFITLVGDGYFPFEALYHYPVQQASEFNPLTITENAFSRSKVVDYSWRDVLRWHPPSLKVFGVNFVASLNRFRK